jgi:CheY-like chemotaxis protein
VTLGNHDGDAQIEVIDSGIGISPEFLPYVFDRYGGTVSVESDGENKGTTFRLQLSLHSGPAPEVADSPFRRTSDHVIEVELEQLNGVHILIVEDDTDSRNVLAVLLQRLGALVEAVASASEAFDRVSHRRPDVLVSDIGMPDEDGYSLIKRVRQLGGERKLPAIALTAYARKQDAEQAIASGYDRHLPKPVAPADLIKAIKSVTVEITNTK